MKKVIAAILCLTMVLTLMACGGSGGSSSAASGESETTEPITLTWVGAGWQANGNADTIISRWKEVHPEIEINYIELGSLVDQEYLKNLDVMISGGEVVDVTYLGVDDAYNRFMNGGATALDEYVAAAGDDYVALYSEADKLSLSYDGSLYGMPWANNTFKVFYNKTYCDEHNVTIPDKMTIDQFVEIAKELNDPANDFYGCVFPSTWYDIILVPAELDGWHSVEKDADGNLYPNYDDDRLRTVMQWAYDMAEVDKVTPSYATIMAESLNRRQALATHQTAMIIDGPYTLVWMQNYQFNDPGDGPLDFELGVAEVPYLSEDDYGVCYNALVGTFYVPKTSAHPAEAYEFEKFITTQCYDLTYMPAYADADMTVAAATLDNFTDANGEEHHNIYPEGIAVKAVSTPGESHVSAYGKDPTLAQYYNLMYTLFGEQYTMYLSGEMTLDEFVDTMQTLGAQEIANAS